MLKVDAMHKLLSNAYRNSDEEWLAMKKDSIMKTKCQVKNYLTNIIIMSRI